MTTMHILAVILGTLTVTVLAALGLTFLGMARLVEKMADELADAPCCYRPDIVDRDCDGVTFPFCMNCGLYQRSPLEAAPKSSPGTSGRASWSVLRKEGWMRPWRGLVRFP